MRFWCSVSVLLLLAACSRPSTPDKTDDTAAAVAAESSGASPASAVSAQSQAAAASMTTASAAAAAAPSPAHRVADSAVRPADPSTPQLAYKYDYGVRLPAVRVRSMLDLDRQACEAAGPATCQVTALSLQGVGGETLGRLDLRATEPWLSRFRADIAGQAEDFGGQLIRADLDGQDLSGSIGAARTAIRTQATLRNRVQKLFERPGRLTDVMATGQQLAQAQSDVDTSRSQLADLRNRIAMSRLSVNYQGEALVLASLAQPLVWTLAALGALIGWLAYARRKPDAANRPDGPHAQA
jgi:hypothetical protein